LPTKKPPMGPGASFRHLVGFRTVRAERGLVNRWVSTYLPRRGGPADIRTITGQQPGMDIFDPLCNVARRLGRPAPGERDDVRGHAGDLGTKGARLGLSSPRWLATRLLEELLVKAG
jgi:hypothetical protein